MFVWKNLSFHIDVDKTVENISDITLLSSSRDVLRHERSLRLQKNWEIWQIMFSFVANIGHGPNGECQPQMLWQVFDWNVPGRTRGLIFSCREEYEGQSLFHLYPRMVSLRVSCQSVRYLVIILLCCLYAWPTLQNYSEVPENRTPSSWLPIVNGNESPKSLEAL